MGRWVWDAKREQWEWKTAYGEILQAWNSEEQEIFNIRAERGEGLLLDEEGWAVPVPIRRVGF